MSDYRIEPFNLENFNSLKQLFKSSFGVDVDFDFFRKKYDTDTIGGKAISYVAVYNETNEIVAHYAALPVRAMVNKQMITAAQSSDAMTDSRHRKKGLFKLLAQKVHEECRSQGISLIFSQPNQASYHSFIDVFHFQYVDDIARWDLKLNFKTAPLAKILVSPVLRKVYLKYCSGILKKYRISSPFSFINTVATDAAKISRDKDYLDYKNSPDKYFIQIRGVLLWIKLTDLLWIGEIDNYDKVNHLVLKKLRQLAFLLGYNTISFHLNNKVKQPGFLRYFKKYNTEPSTIYYLDKNHANVNLVLTGADFDTW